MRAKAQQASLVCQVFPATPETLARRAHRESPANQDCQVCQVIQVTPARPDLRVLPVSLAWLVYLPCRRRRG